MDNIEILDFSINKSLNELKLDKKKVVVNTINPHSYCVSKKDFIFKKALMNSDILIPDGVGIVWAAKIILGKRVKRIAGADLHSYLLLQLDAVGGKVFYLGSSVDTLQKVKEKIVSEYENIEFSCYSPPYKSSFSDEESKKMITAVNDFKPDVLFIGMTAPKQEKWAYQYKNQIDANIIASIGAVFDFYAGTVKRPGKVWIKLGLEWFPRLVRDPKRLWRRTFISTPIFVFDVLKNKLINKFTV